MADANASLALSTTDQIIFNTDGTDTACRTMIFINRDTTIWALVKIRGLHGGTGYAAIPPNQTPIPFSFPSGSIEQVSVKSESGTPNLAYFVAVR